MSNLKNEIDNFKIKSVYTDLESTYTKLASIIETYKKSPTKEDEYSYSIITSFFDKLRCSNSFLNKKIIAEGKDDKGIFLKTPRIYKSTRTYKKSIEINIDKTLNEIRYPVPEKQEGDDIICPYCEQKYNHSWEYVNDDGCEITCLSCLHIFKLDVSVTYSTCRISNPI